MATARKLTLCLTGCDEWAGFMTAMSLAKGSARQYIEKMYCGVMDESTRFAKMLRDQGMHMVKYSKDQMDRLGQCFQRCQLVVMPPAYDGYRGDEQCGMRMFEQWLKLAQKHQVRCVTMLSALHAEQGQGRHFKLLMEREKMLKRMVSGQGQGQSQSQSQMHGCIMRVSPVMEHAFLHQHRIQQERTLMMPLGDHEFTPVAMMDVCEALVCMASKMMSARQDTDCGDCGGVGGAHHVITYCCTGKEPMTAKRMAEAASKALGTQIQHREVSWDEFKRELEQHGHLQEHEMECAREMMEMIKRDMMKEVTQDLQKLLKREPMTVVQFFEHHQDSFKPRQ